MPDKQTSTIAKLPSHLPAEEVICCYLVSLCRAKTEHSIIRIYCYYLNFQTPATARLSPLTSRSAFSIISSVPAGQLDFNIPLEPTGLTALFLHARRILAGFRQINVLHCPIEITTWGGFCKSQCSVILYVSSQVQPSDLRNSAMNSALR